MHHDCVSKSFSISLLSRHPFFPYINSGFFMCQLKMHIKKVDGNALNEGGDLDELKSLSHLTLLSYQSITVSYKTITTGDSSMNSV